MCVSERAHALPQCIFVVRGTISVFWEGTHGCEKEWAREPFEIFFDYGFVNYCMAGLLSLTQYARFGWKYEFYVSHNYYGPSFSFPTTKMRKTTEYGEYLAIKSMHEICVVDYLVVLCRSEMWITARSK